MHLFRQPYDSHFISAFTGFQTEFTGDFIAFLCVDNCLPVFRSHCVQPMVQRKIRIVQHKVSPIGYVVVTDFLLPFGAFHYGEYEVYVRMYQLIPFYTRGTRTACVSLRTVRATDITGVSQSKRKFSSSCRAAEKLCMRDTSFLHFLYQSLFGCFLADYIFKKHDGDI